MFTLSLFLVSVFFMLNFILVKSNNFKSFFLMFECGFDSILWKMSKMSVHFFKIGIIFVVFDLELMFILFLIKNSVSHNLIVMIHFFILSTYLVEGVNAIFKWSF